MSLWGGGEELENKAAGRAVLDWGLSAHLGLLRFENPIISRGKDAAAPRLTLLGEKRAQEHLKGEEEEDGSRSICLRAWAALSRTSPARGALQHPQCVCQPWDTCGHYIRGRAQSVVVCAAGTPSVLPLMCGCRGQGQRGDVPACAGGRDCGLCAR